MLLTDVTLIVTLDCLLSAKFIGCKKEALPRFELGLSVSETDVIATTL